MANSLFLRIALPTPLRRLFDYLPPQDVDPQALVPGVRIRVPFQTRSLVGVLISVEKESSVPYGKLKKAVEILDEHPLFPPDVYKLCQWAADYYHYALGEVLSAAMPALLRKGNPISASKALKHEMRANAITPLTLNTDQQTAIDAIC